MLFVILFHVALDRGDPFYGLRRCGSVHCAKEIKRLGFIVVLAAAYK